MENPPLRLLLGRGMAQWKALTLSTGFAPATIA